jgi:hypothetical protein
MTNTYSGADPGFQVRGGALKKIAPSGGRRENLWGISCENHDFTPKNHMFSNFRGGGPGSAPAICIVFCHLRSRFIVNSNMPSFFRFVKKWAIYRLGIISLAHAPVHVTDFPVVNVHVDELSSARIWQHNLCATLATNVNINYRLPIKIYYRICTLRNIRIEIIHGSQNVFWALLISVNPC